jgi:hypothetical protein
MRIRRPLAALMTALALFGGGATLTACGDPSGTDRSDGSTDDTGDQGGDNTNRENEEAGGDLPDNSDPEPNTEDRTDDQQDPD